jgi:hypothetical protein
LKPGIDLVFGDEPVEGKLFVEAQVKKAMNDLNVPADIKKLFRKGFQVKYVFEFQEDINVSSLQQYAYSRETEGELTYYKLLRESPDGKKQVGMIIKHNPVMQGSFGRVTKCDEIFVGVFDRLKKLLGLGAIVLHQQNQSTVTEVCANRVSKLGFLGRESF